MRGARAFSEPTRSFTALQGQQGSLRSTRWCTANETPSTIASRCRCTVMKRTASGSFIDRREFRRVGGDGGRLRTSRSSLETGVSAGFVTRRCDTVVCSVSFFSAFTTSVSISFFSVLDTSGSFSFFGVSDSFSFFGVSGSFSALDTSGSFSILGVSDSFSALLSSSRLK